MRRRDREINIFNIAFLDVITGAMGAFVLMVLLLAPYYSSDVTNRQKEEAVRKALNQVEEKIDQASRAVQPNADPSVLRRALNEAQAALKQARDQLQQLRQQLDQIASQNRRLDALDHRLEAELRDLKNEAAALEQKLAVVQAQNQTLQQRIAELEARNRQLAQNSPAGAQLVNAAAEAKMSPLVITTNSACRDVSANVYVWSRFKPGVELVTNSADKSGPTASKSDVVADPSFDPAKPPSPGTPDEHLLGGLTGHNGLGIISKSKDGYKLTFNLAPTNAQPQVGERATDRAATPFSGTQEEIPPDRFVTQWILDHADWRSEIRVFYVLAAPLSFVSTSGDSCTIRSRIAAYGRLLEINGREISSERPVILAAIINLGIAGQVNVEVPEAPGINRLNDEERKNVDAWLRKTEDVRFPVKAAKEGRLTPEIHKSMEALYAHLRTAGGFMGGVPDAWKREPLKSQLEAIKSILGIDDRQDPNFKPPPQEKCRTGPSGMTICEPGAGGKPGNNAQTAPMR